MKKSKERILSIKLIMIVVVFSCISEQASVSPVYTASPHSRSGTWIAFTSLKT